MHSTILNAIRDQIVGQRCWLVVGGREYEAKIAGRLNPFASVAPLDPSIPAVEFAWHTANRIIRTHKTFHA